jgi:hypothetical protein
MLHSFNSIGKIKGSTQFFLQDSAAGYAAIELLEALAESAG